MDMTNEKLVSTYCDAIYELFKQFTALRICEFKL